MATELRNVLSFVLPESSWAEVQEVLDIIEAALQTNDEAAVVAAVKELAVFGGTRTRIGGPPSGPPPEPIRERVNRLIHELGRPAQLTAAEEPSREGQRDRGR